MIEQRKEERIHMRKGERVVEKEQKRERESKEDRKEREQRRVEHQLINSNVYLFSSLLFHYSYKIEK